MAVRILFLADSHLGIDLPITARVERRRRGHDFLANYAKALQPAFAGEVDLVVHGGDVFDVPRVHPTLAYQAFEPLVQIARRGIPVFIVPGNHERGVLPHRRFAAHPLIHIFDRARSFTIDVQGVRIVLAGFPYERKHVRTRFPQLLENTGWKSEDAAVRLLCIHHCVEGATVGPANFTFTTAPDVIRCTDLPPEFAAIFSGHIHRQQVLTHDLRRRPINAPVLYPGSIERTAFAEAGEAKGYFIVTIAENGHAHWQSRPLYARPMISVELPGHDDLAAVLADLIESVARDAVLRVRVVGELTKGNARVLSAAHLREIAPPTMNIEISAVAALRHFPSVGTLDS